MTLLVARMIDERFHRDVEGRPIREGRTPTELLRDGDIGYRARSLDPRLTVAALG